LPSISDSARRAAAHPAFLAVVAVGATMRILTMVAYTPALFFGDSWDYIVDAFSGHPVAISSNRPSVYGWLIRLFTLPSRDFVELVGFQHLAGLITGTLVYVLLLRARIPSTIAAAAAALVILDGYVITLEQYVMAEAFFILTLVLAAALLLWKVRPGARITALVGLLLGAATLQRQSGLFVVPVFAIYLLWCRIGWRALAAFVIAFALPVCAYAARFDMRYGTFGLSRTSGWTLYGRVAEFADCSGAGIAADARFLCETPTQKAEHPDAPTWYIFDPSSRAVERYGAYGSHSARGVNSNGILAAFARRIILHQPLDYLDAVASDVLRFFTPGATPFADSVSATSLPEHASAENVVQDVKSRYLPSLHPRVRSPASVVRAYRSVIHVPRPVIALLALCSLAALALRLPARREVLLLSGSGLILIVGVAASAGFGIRYLLPAVPFFALGGTLAGRDLVEYARRTAGPRRSRAARARP
jgi:Dolichyl-phosphate-mannose-protein mannosyltransferase